MIDLTALKELAKAATPGKWQHNCHGYIYGEKNSLVQGSGDADQGALIRIEDAAFIAAAYPSTVLELLARLERAENLLASIERRAGSASHASGYTDATECAEWVRAYFASESSVEDGKGPG
jgi:AraC-like DNA-binding protein